MSDARLRELERQAATGDPAALAALQREQDRLEPPLAVLSCVHANLEALEAVLADIDDQGIGEVICLGDLVGYGPDPVACVDLIMNRCAVTLMGRHDHSLLHGFEHFNARHQKTMAWTRTQLQPGLFAGPRARARWSFLSSLPSRHERSSDLFVHGSPRDPVNELISHHELGFGPTEKMTEIFASFEGRLFVGATHTPGVIVEETLSGCSPEEFDRSTHGPSGRVIVNVGAVGQSRDRDPRACYVVVRGSRFTWRRVEYDLERTVAKILKQQDHLPASFGERLRLGI